MDGRRGGRGAGGRGLQGARDDYEHAVKVTAGVTTYDIDSLVARDDAVAMAWTGHLPPNQSSAA